MLEVEHLSKNFRWFALNDITFTLPKGYIMGLIGANGSGKTTIIKCLLGLYQMDGTVSIDHMKLSEEEASIKDMVGVVLEEDFFNQEMSAIGNGKVYGKLFRHFHMEEFLNYLNRFGVDLNKKIGKLSKGYRMRFQLAFALSHEAKLFIFDEPSDGLDSDFRKELLRICTELIEDGEKSVLFSTHITQDLDQIADYITYIDHGKLLLSMEKDTLCDLFRMVEAEDYKIRLLPQQDIVYCEKGTYSSRAMIRNSNRIASDADYLVSSPTVDDIMYYFTKGGIEHACSFIA